MDSPIQPFRDLMEQGAGSSISGVSGYYEVERVVTRHDGPPVVCTPGWGGSAGGPINAGQNQRTLEGLRGRTVGVL